MDEYNSKAKIKIIQIREDPFEFNLDIKIVYSNSGDSNDCKSIIDKIDNELAKHYGFTD